MYSEAQKRATMKWKKKAIKRYEINLNKDTDADIIGYLDGKNVQGMFKKLMRARMQKNIFTNRQVNLIKTLIDMRVNELTDYIEEAEDVIKTQREVIGKLKTKGNAESVAKRNETRIRRYESDVKGWQNENQELKELREYIDGVYYGE